MVERRANVVTQDILDKFTADSNRKHEQNQRITERLEKKIDDIGAIVTKWTGAIDMVKWGLPLLIGLVALCCTMLGYALANRGAHSALTKNSSTVTASSAPSQESLVK
jgi:uncharacterized membrane protein